MSLILTMQTYYRKWILSYLRTTSQIVIKILLVFRIELLVLGCKCKDLRMKSFLRCIDGCLFTTIKGLDRRFNYSIMAPVFILTIFCTELFLSSHTETKSAFNVIDFNFKFSTTVNRSLLVLPLYILYTS